LNRLFGFVQFDFAGPLALADGRYLVREAGGDEWVLVVGTLGAPPAARRRRRRARDVGEAGDPSSLPLTRVTAIRAFAPFDDEGAAGRWLDEATETEDTVDVLVAEAVELLNRALHVQAVAAADTRSQALGAERAAAVRIGYGSGEETADGRFSAAREVDAGAGATSRRHQREQELRPQERVAAVLGGREQLDACETLLLRARADLDACREREAALQLRGGLDALLTELRGELDEGHARDMDALRERSDAATAVAEAAADGALTSAQGHELREQLEIAERVLRRRRVLRG
jgi:hypothetical protein